MKKRTIIALIVAAALILSGGMILLLGLSFAGDASYVEAGMVSQEATLTDSFDSVAINTRDCDVKFVPYNGDVDAQVTVTGMSDSVSHSILVEDGTLKIDMIDERKWTDHINIGWTESMEMTVYLPAAEYESLQVRTDTGDIVLTQEPFFREVMLRSDTGDISCVGVSGDALDCMTRTGDISVQNSAPNILKLQSSTGDFKVRVVAGDEIHMKTNTGEVDAENVNVQMFTCSTNTGDVKLEKVLAEDYLQVFTDTGDICSTNSDAPKVNIETDTGDITIPAAWEFQQIETNTGDIYFA